MYANQNPGNNVAGEMEPTEQQQSPYNGMHQQQQQQQQQHHHPQQQQQEQTAKNVRKKAFVKITEQPASKALRFRYECEGRSAGSIPGVNSTPENKTFPTIKIVGYKGRAVVVVSCVTKDAPYRPHPHNLVGKEGCKKGVCTLEINSETMRAVFSNLGIQCVKKKDIEAALKAREEIRVDPFKTGFSHRFQPSSIDLNAVRLCFQVFMESEQKGRFTQPLPPVVSEPIYDKKAMSDLVICRLCSCSATVLGNTQIILLCEKVVKEDIAVRFFEEKHGELVWEAFGEFHHTDVHKQTAITFKTPRYHTMDITEPAKVFVQLRRPSDGVTSEALPFEFLPLDSDPAHLRRKRQKTGGDAMHLLLQQQQKQQKSDHADGPGSIARCWNPPHTVQPIKTEPRDTSPQPFAMYRTPPQLTPSPQPLSPSQNFHNQNIPAPFGVNAAAGVGVGSPNQQFKMDVGVVATGSAYPTPTATATPMHDYASYGQETQKQQQQREKHQQQQFVSNPFMGAGARLWEQKYASNHLMSNQFAMHNLLAPAESAAAAAAATYQHHWNLAYNPQLLNQQQNQQQHEQQPLHYHHLQQQPFQQPQQAPAEGGERAANAAAPVGSSNERGPTISNLLSFDSEQLVHMNSEDQQMLRLNSEDLQISNLSIST